MKIAVLKISGKAIDDFFNGLSWKESLNEIKKFYDGMVIVHGAGNDISKWSIALGHEVKFKNGQRVTSKEVMDVVAAVQSGILNSKIVSRLNSFGLEAVGFSGIDRGSFIAEVVDEEMGFVGVPSQVGSIEWIHDLLREEVIPVFSSICRDVDGNLINVNADIFTEVLSTAIIAESVFFMSDVSGVILRGKIQRRVSNQEILDGIFNGEITEGMIPKLNSCIELLNKGIKKIWIGSVLENKTFANLNDHSSGTWIIQSS
jgi:acetylglutamate kinase